MHEVTSSRFPGRCRRRRTSRSSTPGHGTIACRTVLAIVRDVDLAQDLVAEAFARAWASWRKVSRHPAPRAWLVRTRRPLVVVESGEHAVQQSGLAGEIQ